jgi:FkbM family methyltransferase
MYVDKHRFALEPEALAGADDGPLRALFRGARGKAGMLVRIARAFPAVSRAYRALGNKESKAIFRDLLRYRLLGAYYSRIAYDRDLYEGVENVLAEDIPSEMPLDPMKDPIGKEIRLWTVQYKGRPLKFYGSKPSAYSVRDGHQYYYDVGGVKIMPEEGDVLLDGGAYLGEMTMRFAADVGPSGKVIGFDPLPSHAKIASEVARRNQVQDRVRFVAAGLGSKSSVTSLDEVLAPTEAGDALAINSGRRVGTDDRLITIDDYCAWSGVERVDFIKMDIEASEIAALKSSHETILKWKPKLAICVYHRYDDLWVITNLVRERYPFYDLYLGHYTLHSEETVLYARPRPGA